MATRLACERADVVSAIAPVAGTLGTAFPCAPSRPVSVMEVHGSADPVVPFGGGSMLGRGGYSDIVAAPAMAERWRALDGCPGPVEESCRVPATAPRCIARRDALAVLRSSSSKSTVAVTRGPQTHRKLVGSSSPRTAGEQSEVSRLRAGEMAQELIMKIDHNTEPIGA